mmetsp:Transcript_32541/g.37650  ORF Transcript_32541/g.37650 Transcript_32541/m.37650 type:complete len:138 (+) Transcript_32541:135-548(+)
MELGPGYAPCDGGGDWLTPKIGLLTEDVLALEELTDEGCCCTCTSGSFTPLPTPTLLVAENGPTGCDEPGRGSTETPEGLLGTRPTTTCWGNGVGPGPINVPGLEAFPLGKLLYGPPEFIVFPLVPGDEYPTVNGLD